MLGSVSVTSIPTMHTDNANAQPSSPRPSGRLRGLSYLRNYSQATPAERPELASSAESQRAQSSQLPHRRSASTATGQTTADNDTSPATRPFRSRDSSSRLAGAMAASASQASTGGWLPSVDGSPGLARAAATTQLYPSPVTSRTRRHAPTAAGTSEEYIGMTRHRSATSPNNIPATLDLGALRAARRISNPVGRAPVAAPLPATNPSLPSSQLPSIQLVPYQDPRSHRPSLNFNTTTRTLPGTESKIRVGRYSERDTAQPPEANDVPSDAPVGFKSKVVSRRHCEFFYQGNQWFVKDVKSSSGTFLNHIRLSPPGEESRPFAIKDGDLVQLGIDFKGGEEMIFRCVKIRILCNRGWQKSVNKFNKSAHKRLNDLQKTSSKDIEAAQNSTECTICLNSIAPCQPLFVAPCSHTWHYKCIRPMLEQAARSSTDEMTFHCPNCRDVADLDADIEECPGWEDSEAGEDSDAEQDLDATQVGRQTPKSSTMYGNDLATRINDLDLGDLSLFEDGTAPQVQTAQNGLNPGASTFVPNPSSATNGMPRSNLRAQHGTDATLSGSQVDDTAPSPTSSSSASSFGVHVTRTAPTSSTRARPPQLPGVIFSSPPPDGDADGPLTPRNNAGPFVFDGAAGANPSVSQDVVAEAAFGSATRPGSSRRTMQDEID